QVNAVRVRGINVVKSPAYWVWRPAKSNGQATTWMKGCVGDEAVHKELGDRMERVAANASSLEAEQDNGSGPRCQDTLLGDVDAQTRFESTSK
ncbi:hypothetical protein Tco_0095980, partial [Tanacetum coccineum]